MMSTSGESSDGEAEQYEPAIAPLAPKVILQEEGQVEVSASPAFQCLDEVRIQLIGTIIFFGMGWGPKVTKSQWQ